MKNPVVKYTLGRLGLFLVVFVASLPLPLNILVKAMIAFVISAVVSRFLLTRWLEETGEYFAAAAARRAAEKQSLRSALAGDENAATAGDRVAAATARAEAADAKRAETAADGTDGPADRRD